MRRKTMMIGLGIMLGALSVSAFAGDVPNDKGNTGNAFAPADQMTSIIKKLAQATDVWHDANLEGDHGTIVKSERVVFEVIQADIDYSRARLEKARRIADSIGTVISREKVKQATGMLRAKERVLRSLRRAQAFSNKYRLLGDYIELLKIERRANSVELVESHGRAATTDSIEGER